MVKTFGKFRIKLEVNIYGCHIYVSNNWLILIFEVALCLKFKFNFKN